MNRAKVIQKIKGQLRGHASIRKLSTAKRGAELKARLKRAQTPTVKPKGRLPNPRIGVARLTRLLKDHAAGKHDKGFEPYCGQCEANARYLNRLDASKRRTRARDKKISAIRRNGFFDSDAIASAKKVKRIHKVQERNTKEGGEIIGVQPGGFIKVKWDNRERPTLIKRSEIKRYPQLRMNPGIMELAGGLQALDYLGEKVGVGKRRRNPVRKIEVERALTEYKDAERQYGPNALVTQAFFSRYYRLKQQHEAAQKKVQKVRRVNPSVNEMSERFQGRATGSTEEYYFSDSAPRLDMSRGGKLVFLKLKGTTIRVPASVVAIDAKLEKLWLGCKSLTGMFKRKAKPGEQLDYGDVDAICYLTAKKHIGNSKPYEYVHNFGENGGRKPRLLIDHEGMPILKGGDYKIEDRGIVN